jgi:branched-chain amino acid transport system ATP-binding protein
MQADVFAAVRDIASQGVTVLVVEQNVHGALLISNTAIVMELGRKFMEGPAAIVREDARIREAYLGGNIKEANGG